MSLFGLFFRDQLKTPELDEFENLSSRMAAWALREHNEDGTHNVRPSGFDFVPIGGIISWPSDTIPSGWLLCDGSQISRTTYQALFNVVGTTFGAGDGSTTFNIPDFRQKFALGKAASGTGATLGSSGGVIDHTHTTPALTVPSLTTSGSTNFAGTHNHGAQTGDESSHTHPFSGTTDQEFLVLVSADGVFASASGVPHHTHSFSGTTSSGSAHHHTINSDGSHSHTTSGTTSTGAIAANVTGSSNPPYLVINQIILAGV